MMAEPNLNLLAYPVDILPFLKRDGTTETLGTSHDMTAGICALNDHPDEIAVQALMHWHAYRNYAMDDDKTLFLRLALWLLEHETRFTDGTGGWLVAWQIELDTPYHLMLSARVQGTCISVLTRAYQLTGQDRFLQAAWRAVGTCNHDILDGGINTPIGDHGFFFEEVGAYPATHTLSGCLLALFGLYDYFALTGDRRVDELIVCGLTGLHDLIDAFDTGYWTYTDLLQKRLASRSQHALHILLFQALAHYSACEQYAMLATRWARYTYSFRYALSNHLIASYERSLNAILRHLTLPAPPMARQQVYVSLQVFPIPGGMRSVLAGMAAAMEKQWQMTYLTGIQGRKSVGLTIELFGLGKITTPWQFPNVWCYALAGGYTLFRLLCCRPEVKLILPQDGLYSAAFSAIVGKLMGRRVVCMDHGSIISLTYPAFRGESMSATEAYSHPQHFRARLRSACYWSSLHLLAQLATRGVDHFLIAGDEVEMVYRQHLGVHTSRITRYAYTVDAAAFIPLPKEARDRIRRAQGLAEDAIVITLVNRLIPEKGLNFAIEGIAWALAQLAPIIRQRVRVLIVGDGPLRTQVEATIADYRLEKVCIVWGEAGPSEVVMLLGISDIFLSSGTYGTNYSMAVLEAMAAGCAVIATTSPQSNIHLLAEGRGLVIAPADARATGTAITHLCNNQTLCRQMGQAARAYVEHYHSPAMLQRTLSRIGYFIPTLQEKQITSEQILLSQS